MICSVCGCNINDGAVFCGNCGNKIDLSPIRCSKCGTENDKKFHFCCRCGSILENLEVYNYGKEKCKLLRQIRKTIAQLNDIDIIFEECKHEGLCTGTCHLCEKELSLLENEIEKKKQNGDRVFLPEITVNKNDVFPKKKISDFDITTAGVPMPISRFKSGKKVEKRFPWSK